MHFHRKGGLTFWRIGRLGGSFYLARRRPAAATTADHRLRRHERIASRLTWGYAWAVTFILSVWLVAGFVHSFI
jgi:hypothetical protein